MEFIKNLKSMPKIKRRLIAIFVAHIFIGLSINFLRLAFFGNDPFSCMNLGFSNFSGLSFGTCVIIFNLIMIVAVFFIDKSYVQIGTLINLILLGSISDAWYKILNLIPNISEPSMTLRIIFLIVGVLLACAFGSLYMCTRLGMGPYDAIGWIVEQKSGGKIHFKYARIILDSFATGIGFFFGSIVGFGTLIMAIGTGPLIAFFSENFSMPLIYGKKIF